MAVYAKREKLTFIGIGLFLNGLWTAINFCISAFDKFQATKDLLAAMGAGIYTVTHDPISLGLLALTALCFWVCRDDLMPFWSRMFPAKAQDATVAVERCKLKILYDRDQNDTPTRPGGRRHVRVINDSALSVKAVRLRIASVHSEPPDERRQKKANRVNGRNLTKVDGEPSRPGAGDRAIDEFDLLPDGGWEAVEVVSLYRRGVCYVLVSTGYWKDGEWKRHDSELDKGIYRIVVEAVADAGFGRAEFRFGVRGEGEQAELIFEQIQSV